MKLLDNESLKNVLADFVASRVKDGEVIGLGTGSSAEAVVRAIGRRIQNESINVSGVSTSMVTTSVASEVGISLIPLSKVSKIDWGFDGADEVAPDKILLKGKGGALLREKIVARMLPKFLVVVTEDKLVKNIGERFPVPVEVVPESIFYVERELLALGATTVVTRTGSNFYGPLFTESGNVLLDATFPEVTFALGSSIKQITGVVEHGLFTGFSSIEIASIKQDGSIDVW